MNILRDRSKSAVQTRRALYITAPLAGILLWAMRHYLFVELTPQTPHSFFFGSMANWPGFVKNGWAPLDIIEIMLAFAGSMVMFMRSDGKTFHSPPVKFGLRLLGFSFLYGNLLGLVLGTLLGGWYIGLESAPLLGAFITGVFAAVGTFMGIVFGSGWLISKGSKWLWYNHLSKIHLRGRFGGLRKIFRPIGKAFSPISRYFNAADIPDTVPEEATTNNNQ
ncbi:MAG TPA: hypothetical protein VLF91_02380 [Candidatus Saccharimonadales bacterium]|nr:hypothetical protein [Candidatus Saccharimonadales bacterium]